LVLLFRKHSTCVHPISGPPVQNEFQSSVSRGSSDRHAGNSVLGLTTSDFTLLEDGRPQKIAFFGEEDQPISLAILLDSSRSMKSSRKLERALALLSPLIRGNQPDDEIFLVPFTDQIGPFTSLSPEQRLNPPLVHAPSAGGGTALYDALATALCHLRTARNMRQAVVVITDGAEQHSRLRIEQLINLTRSSQPQIFMIGFWGRQESEYYRQSDRMVTLVSGHEIDNPLRVFEDIAKESGAESFFPTSERELKQVLERILGILRAQYTIAYYPKNIERFRRIQVTVRRSGVVVTARRAVGFGSAGQGGRSLQRGFMRSFPDRASLSLGAAGEAGCPGDHNLPGKLLGPSHWLAESRRVAIRV